MKRTIRRRRLEAKTDYKARITLLKSGKTRLVVRKTNKYLIAQFVSSDVAQDKVISGVISRDLIAKGWPEALKGSLKSIPAAYLTGFLLGKKASSKVKEAILDMGMQRNIQKSRLYAVLKGAIDAGVKIPHGEEAIPSTEKLETHKSLKDAFKKIKQSI